MEPICGKGSIEGRLVAYLAAPLNYEQKYCSWRLSLSTEPLLSAIQCAIYCTSGSAIYCAYIRHSRMRIRMRMRIRIRMRMRSVRAAGFEPAQGNLDLQLSLWS
jgi:hypothetical protein